MQLCQSIVTQHAQPDYRWLDSKKPFFGAKNGGKWLFQEKGDENLNFLFELRDPRFPGGRAIGKCNLMSRHEPLFDAPDGFEAKMLAFLASNECSELPCSSSLPDVYAIHSFVPIYCLGLSHLPMRAASVRAHAYCDVIFAKAYWGNLSDLTRVAGKQIPVDVWKYILFDVAHTLYVLQESIGFQHHDLHDKNVLIDKLREPITKMFDVDGKSFTFGNLNLSVTYWDFETAVCFQEQVKSRKRRNRHDKSIPNITVPAVLRQNDNRGPSDSKPEQLLKYYDLHQFLMHVLERPYLPDEIAAFIRSLYPPELITDFDEVQRQIEQMEEEDEMNDDEMDDGSEASGEDDLSHDTNPDDFGEDEVDFDVLVMRKLNNLNAEGASDDLKAPLIRYLSMRADKRGFLRDLKRLCILASDVPDTVKVWLEDFESHHGEINIDTNDSRDATSLLTSILKNSSAYFTPEVAVPLRAYLSSEVRDEMDDTEIARVIDSEIDDETLDDGNDVANKIDDSEIDDSEIGDSEIGDEADTKVSNGARFYPRNATFAHYALHDVENVEEEMKNFNTYSYYPPNERNTLVYVKLLEHTWAKYGSSLITPKQFLQSAFFDEFRTERT